CRSTSPKRIRPANTERTVSAASSATCPRYEQNATATAPGSVIRPMPWGRMCGRDSVGFPAGSQAQLLRLFLVRIHLGWKSAHKLRLQPGLVENRFQRDEI